MPTIWPASFIARALSRYILGSPTTSALRSIITPCCHRKARDGASGPGLHSGVSGQEAPTTWPRLLIQLAILPASPSTAPRLCIPACRVHRKAWSAVAPDTPTTSPWLLMEYAVLIVLLLPGAS